MILTETLKRESAQLAERLLLGLNGRWPIVLKRTAMFRLPVVQHGEASGGFLFDERKLPTTEF
jgi:hypothetical protein